MQRRLSMCSVLAVVLVTQPLVASAQPGQPAARTSPQQPASSDDGLVTVTLRDGQLLRGHILAETEGYVILRLVSGGEMSVAQADIRDLKRNDPTVFVSGTREIYKHDPNRTRYLYGPSAFMLRKGEGYFSQTELLFSTLGIGVTDWLTIQVGSMVPALFAGEDGTNVIFGARVGMPLSDKVHVAAGFNSLVLPDIGAFGLATGSVTFGTPKSHFTLSGGYPFSMTDSGNEVGNVFASASGNLRVSKGFAAVTENWFLPVDGEIHVLTSVAGRFMGERSAVDVGFVFVEGSEVPIPWLDFTWNWN